MSKLQELWQCGPRKAGYSAAVLAVVLICGAQCAAQTAAYEELGRDSPPPTPQFQAALTTKLIPSGRFATAEDAKGLESYYANALAEMTWAKSLASLHTRRGAIKRNLQDSGRAPSGEVHTAINRVLLAQLPPLIANDKLHPAARFNYVLILGELNETEPGVGGDGAMPFKEATPLLLDYTQPTSVDWLRNAALVGLLRQAQTEKGIAAEQVPQVVKALVQIVQTKQPPAGHSHDIHTWIRRRAAQVLSAMAAKSPAGNSPEVLTALLNLMKDESAGLQARAEAAQALGTLEQTSFSQTPASGVAREVADLIVAVAKANTDNNKAEMQKSLSAPGGGFGGPRPGGAGPYGPSPYGPPRGPSPYGPGGAASRGPGGANPYGPSPYGASPYGTATTTARGPELKPIDKIKLLRDRATYQLGCAIVAFNGAVEKRGLLAAADDQTKAFVAGVLKRSEPILNVLNNESVTDEGIRAMALLKSRQELENFLAAQDKGRMAVRASAPAVVGQPAAAPPPAAKGPPAGATNPAAATVAN